MFLLFVLPAGREGTAKKQAACYVSQFRATEYNSAGNFALGQRKETIVPLKGSFVMLKRADCLQHSSGGVTLSEGGDECESVNGGKLSPANS